MRRPVVALAMVSALPCARGFLRSSRFVATRRHVGVDSSSTCSTIRRCRATTELFMITDRMTDEEREFVSLDTSTLDESEKKRIEGIRAIRSKTLEADQKRLELWKQDQREKQMAHIIEMEERDRAVEASGIYDGMTRDQRRRAESLASIEESLAEVAAIQRELGIAVDEDERDLEVVDTAWSGQAGLEATDAGGGSRNWSDLSARRWLAVGDAGALTMFAYIGRASHGMVSLDLGVLGTALPFLIGWLAVSPFLGAHTRSATASADSAAKALLPAWAVSMPVAICLRALSKGGELPPVPFMVTSMIFTLAVLMAWRQLYTAVNPTGEGDKQAGLLDWFRMVTTLLQRW